MRTLILFLSLAIISCNQKQKAEPSTEDFKKIAAVVETHLRAELPAINTIDSFFFVVDTITAKDLLMIQAADYTIAGLNWQGEKEGYTNNGFTRDISEAGMKENWSKADSCRLVAKNADSTTALLYQVQPYIVVTQKNMVRSTVKARVFIDKDFKIVPKEQIFQKPFAPSDYDTDKPTLEPYRQIL